MLSPNTIDNIARRAAENNLKHTPEVTDIVQPEDAHFLYAMAMSGAYVGISEALAEDRASPVNRLNSAAEHGAKHALLPPSPDTEQDVSLLSEREFAIWQEAYLKGRDAERDSASHY